MLLVYTKTADSVFRALWLPTQTRDLQSVLFTSALPPSDVKPALVTSKISLTVCFRNKRKNFTNKTKNLFPITRRRPRNLVWQFLQVKLCLFHLNCWFAGDVTAAMLDCWWCVGRQNKSWHVDSSTTNVAALSRGCKPRILRWNRCFLFSNAKSFVTLFGWRVHK